MLQCLYDQKFNYQFLGIFGHYESEEQSHRKLHVSLNLTNKTIIAVSAMPLWKIYQKWVKIVDPKILSNFSKMLNYQQLEREHQLLLHEILDLHPLWRENFDFGNFFDTECDPFHG